jgi:urea transport system substrate-binding protein
MLIEDQNNKGGMLGHKLEPVIVDPASDWNSFAEKARELLTKEKVVVVFGCWTSASRKSVLPIFEQLNSLLFYPIQYEGEESSRNIFYTGATPNQQAIPAARYLMSKEGGEVRRWVLLGTDSVYSRTTDQILSAYLAAEGVSRDDITTIYAPFGYSDWRGTIERIKAFGSEGKKTAVISTVRGDANTYFYREFVERQVDTNAIPVMALSVGERELLSEGIAPVGHLAAWNYFNSINSAENEVFVKMWADFTGERDKITNDPMESHLHWLQDVGTSSCPSRDHRRGCSPASHVRSKDQGAERLRGCDEHQSSSLQASHDRQNKFFRDL